MIIGILLTFQIKIKFYLFIFKNEHTSFCFQEILDQESILSHRDYIEIACLRNNKLNTNKFSKKKKK